MEGYLTIWIRKSLFRHVLSARKGDDSAHVKESVILMTLLLLFHLHRIPINLQLELCDIFSRSSRGKVLDQVDSWDSSLQSPFRCSLPFAELQVHPLLGMHLFPVMLPRMDAVVM
jgi:hypothetical protein